jgi:hypothetical protein
MSRFEDKFAAKRKNIELFMYGLTIIRRLPGKPGVRFILREYFFCYQLSRWSRPLFFMHYYKK